MSVTLSRELLINWLTSGKVEVHILHIDILSTSREIGRKWIPENRIDEKSRFVLGLYSLSGRTPCCKIS